MGKNELIESLRKLPREEQLSVIDEVPQAGRRRCLVRQDVKVVKEGR